MMEPILLANGLLKETVAAIITLYKITKVIVRALRMETQTTSTL